MACGETVSALLVGTLLSFVRAVWDATRVCSARGSCCLIPSPVGATRETDQPFAEAFEAAVADAVAGCLGVEEGELVESSDACGVLAAENGAAATAVVTTVEKGERLLTL